MKKQLRKIALAVVFSLAATMCTPAGQALAATKTFTYAEQNSGDQVTTLFMDCNEKVDLKFLGVSNWKSYKYKWASSNEKVAVVDSNGVITALSEGTTTIKLLVGDGKDYTSTGVLVTVGKSQEVTIGTAAQEEIKSYTLEVGKSVALKANGIRDNVGDRYSFAWSSTDTSVAQVNSNGQLTAVAPGLTVVQLKVTKAFSGEVMEATPIAVLVNSKVVATATPKPTATATPKPTVAPTVAPTAAPTPTKAPDVTATPTPIPSNSSYTIAVSSDRSVTLTFKNKVTYTQKDVEFSQVIEAGNEDILIKLDLESVELDSTGKIMTIKTKDVLATDRYNVKVGTDDAGTTFPVKIGEPNSMKVVYSCLGQENVAYAYDEEIGLDVPVTLSYKLYYDNIDVTESYAYEGYISYELVSPIDSEYVMMTGEQIYFYAANRTAAVQAVYTYYNDNGVEKELKNSANIKAKTIGDYKVTHVANWTIIKDSSTTTIDWNNPVKSVVAGQDGYKIVALLADSYGYYYSTDERGVNREKNIYSVNDVDTLFAMRGYSYAFSPSNDTNYYIDGNGNLYTYAADARAATYITLFNPDEWTSGEKKLDAWQFTIQAESKLNTITVAETNVTLLTESINNQERFCSADVEIQLIDQYKEVWDGEPVLEVTSSSAVLNNDISTVATINKTNGKWVLHIDGQTIADKGIKNSITFYVSDPATNKKSTGIRVLLKNPANANDDIVVGSWDVGMKNATISFGNGDGSDIAAQAEIEIYQISKNGSYKVGLLTEGVKDENGNAVHVKLQDTATYSFTSTTCNEGDIFVLVVGPDGKVVSESSGLGLGVDLTSEGKVVVNVTESSSTSLTSLAEGKYTVRVTKINDISNSYVRKTTKTTYFTVEDNTKDITVVGYNNNRRTSKTVSGVDDPALEEIVLELFIFSLGGSKWTDVTSDMVTKVNCTAQSAAGVYRITSIEFAVPASGDSGITYHKTVKVNQNIYTGVDH